MKPLKFEALVQAAQSNKPIQVLAGTAAVIEVNNLNPGQFYVAPFLFWAQTPRLLSVVLEDPNEKGKVLKNWNFTVGETNIIGDNPWVSKRYKLNDERHNGSATFIISSHGQDSFMLAAAPLTSKKIRRQRLIDQGRCPDCGKKGYWASLALVCEDHGIFI